MAHATVPSCLLASVPVVHPLHLSGEVSLATEILPGPPSIEFLSQKKSDPKKPAFHTSYLPLSDPGTTYTGLSGGASFYRTMDEGGTFRKRARIDRGPSNRSQRATARSLVGSSSQQLSMIDVSSLLGSSDGDVVPSMDEEQFATSSRSASVIPKDDLFIPLQESHTKKGKGRTRLGDHDQLHVKEESVPLQLSELVTVQPNEDHCFSCSSMGSLVYCDGCPRAFHPWCLDPPMDPTEFSDCEDRWYCPGCRQAENVSSRHPRNFFSPLFHHLRLTLPTEFRLPEDIRSYFRDVGTGPHGSYVDSASVKSHRLGRHGVGEERDPYKLKDFKGSSVLCFKCGKSSIPNNDSEDYGTKRRHTSSSDSSAEQWKAIISCDYCNLHWHVDCLNPPLSTYPSFSRKWKCPNHAVANERQRVPKTLGSSIDIKELNRPNNGNIEIIASERSRRSGTTESIPIDEALINGRKYRIPERIIILDFWNKIRKSVIDASRDEISTISSPLTSLTSLDDIDSDHSSYLDTIDHNDDTHQVAELLCQIQGMALSNVKITQNTSRNIRDKCIQTDNDDTVRWRSLEMGAVNSCTKVPFQKLDKIQESSKDHLPTAIPASTRLKTGAKKNQHKSNGVQLVTHGPRRSGKAKSVDLDVSINSQDINKHSSSSLRALPHVQSSAPTKDTKSKTSALKIRIPGRPQQKFQSSPLTTSDQLNNMPHRPRRSLRRHLSNGGPGSRSDRGVSLDDNINT